MKKITIFFIIIAVILIGCTKGGKEDEKLKAYEITDEREIEEFLSHFSCQSGLMGYGHTSIYKADINEDEVYEIYATAFAGSGIINFFIECYDPVTEEVYLLDKRFETDFMLLEYNDVLYAEAYDYGENMMEEPQTIYKIVLEDGEIELQEIRKSLERKIIDEIDE